MSTAPAAHAERLLEYVRILAPLVEAVTWPARCAHHRWPLPTMAAQATRRRRALGGATSIFEGNRIERCFRDVHTATQHGALAPNTLEVVGRVLLGLDPQGLL